MRLFLRTPSGGHTFTAEPWCSQEKLRLPHRGQRHTSNKVLYIKRSQGHFKQSFKFKGQRDTLDKVIQFKSQKSEGQRSSKVRGTLWITLFKVLYVKRFEGQFWTKSFKFKGQKLNGQRDTLNNKVIYIKRLGEHFKQSPLSLKVKVRGTF